MAIPAELPIYRSINAKLWLKGIAEVYYSGGDFCCENITVATKTRHLRPEIGPFPGFKQLVLLNPRSGYENNKEKIFSTVYSNN